MPRKSNALNSAGAGGAGAAAHPGQQLRAARAVFDSIRRIVRVLRLSARHTETAFGLSAAQLLVLHKLAESPTLSPSELAKRTLTDQSSISVVVKRLVDRGYVMRSVSQTDARSFALRLTEAGRTVIKRAPETTHDRLHEAVRHMAPERIALLAELLQELVDHTGLSQEHPTMLMEEDDDAPPLPQAAAKARTRGGRNRNGRRR
jgi:DNA-binding MarR family transcriptional regulator